MNKHYSLKNIFILSICDTHLFYKYDLTLRIPFITILIMWKLTDNGKPYRTNYLSSKAYITRSFKPIWSFQL